MKTVQTECFNELTYAALLDSVLRECSKDAVDADSIGTKSIGIESIGTESLRQAVGNDAQFAAWFVQLAQGESLAAGLVRVCGWRDGTEAAERLWQAANVALRLKCLEQRFATELAVRQREAIYHFAYGLSHELNNPLANIATRAGVLAHREVSVDQRQMLETIIDNALRGSEMLGDLMLLARPPKLHLQRVELAEWFAEFVAQCEPWAATRQVRLEAHLSTFSPQFLFDPIAIKEAVWCLVRNAIEASGSEMKAVVALHVVESLSGLRFTVCDSGSGLSADALKHCFDPYFSGREAGRGLGLGLSKALMIASLHGGTLAVGNLPANGCEALLALPPQVSEHPAPA